MGTRTAPAKINLALDILGARPDGYHDLRMIMQTVSLCDTVTVAATAAGFALESGGAFSPTGQKSLEQRAAEAFFAAIGSPMPGLRVTLQKVTPAYAGLGGGSADVAALLRLLREAYAPELSTAELERIGFTVGSDMPFCVRGGTCLAEGRGEVLTDLTPLPRCWIVLCKPPFGLPTPALFARVDSADLGKRPDISGMVKALEQGDLRGVACRLGNVFQQVLTAEEGREIAAIQASMIEMGALGAAMSGSGPTVFGLFDRRTAAENCRTVLAETYGQTYLAEPVGTFDF